MFGPSNGRYRVVSRWGKVLSLLELGPVGPGRRTDGMVFATRLATVGG